MTTQDTTPRDNSGCASAILEQILEKVESIEESVELILDRLTEYVDRSRDPWDDEAMFDERLD